MSEQQQSLISRIWNATKWESRSDDRDYVGMRDGETFDLYDNGAWKRLFEAQNSFSGERVSEATALGIPAVACAINTISAAIATLPLELHKKTANGTEIDQYLPNKSENPLWTLVHDNVNDELTSRKWREHIMTRTLIEGRSITMIERNKLGLPINLYPLELSKVAIKRANFKTTYTYTPTLGRPIVYASADIIDVVWKTEADNFTHKNPTAQHRNTLGLAIAAERFASIIFENGGVPPLVLHTKTNGPAQAEQASQKIAAALKASRKTKTGVLVAPDNSELKAIGLNPEDTQALQLKQWLVTEVSRIYGVPPSFLHDLTHGTYSNVEQADIAFVKHTLLGWVATLEAEMNLKLFGRSNPSGHMVKFNLDELLRGDLLSRLTAYATAINSAQMTSNEARKLLNLPPVEGGDVLLAQGAMAPLLNLINGQGAPDTLSTINSQSNSPGDQAA